MKKKEKYKKIQNSKFLNNNKKLANINERFKKENLELIYLKNNRLTLTRRFIFFFVGIGFLIVFFQKKYLEFKKEKYKIKYIVPIEIEKNNNLSHISHKILPSDLLAKKADFIKIVDGNKKLQEALDLQKITLKKMNLPLEVINNLGIIFRFVPRGYFFMGSPKSEKKRGETEKLHKVNILNHMYVGKFEITQKVWQKVMGDNPSFFKKSPLHPVEEVSQKDALIFLKKLNKILKVPQGTYSLLSEKEWEYACRAGSNKAFFYGDDAFKLSLFAEYHDNNQATTKPVGGKLPNTWGLYDMHGNVVEWTKTLFWFYDVGKNIYAQSWDKPIYDGDVPMDNLQPIDNFKLTNFSEGQQDNIFYLDLNSNNQYDRNELIWADNPKGYPTQFDYAIDTIIYSVEKEMKKFKNKIGIQTDMYYADANKNGEWNANEKIWIYSKSGRNTQKIILRGGSYNDYSRICRSAARLAIYPDSHSNVWGFRIVRYLKDFDLPYSHGYRED